MKTLILIFLSFSSILVRYIRWFAVVQQKEYRWDRMWLFLRTDEGRKELVRFFPQKQDFTKGGFKRPKITLRILVVVGCTGLLLFISILFFSMWLVSTGLSVAYWVVFFVLFSVMLVVFAPFFVLFGVLPTQVLAAVVTQSVATSARKKIVTQKPFIIGITGSFGKSSTKLLLSHVLSQKYTVFHTPRSYNTLFSIARSVVKGFTSEQFLILEYAAYIPGEIQRVTDYLRPNMAIITGFTPQHIGLFGSEQAIITAKAELVAALREDEVVYFNAAYPKTKEITEVGIQKSGAEKIVTTAVSWDNFFSNPHLNAIGQLEFTWGNQEVKTAFIGTHYIEIVALTWCVAQKYLTKKEFIAALSTYKPASTFTSCTTHQSGARIIDDGGTSNPQGFMSALNTLEALKAKRKIVVTPGIVDLGSKSVEIHRSIAKRLKNVADLVLYVGGTDAATMSEVLGKKCVTEQDQALHVLSSLSSDDIVLLEGRIPSWFSTQLNESTKEKA